MNISYSREAVNTLSNFLTTDDRELKVYMVIDSHVSLLLDDTSVEVSDLKRINHYFKSEKTIGFKVLFVHLFVQKLPYFRPN